MIPEQIPEGFFIELCDTNTVLVRRGVFGSDVHCQLCQVQIGANPGGGGDTGGIQNLPDHGHGEVVGRHFIMSKVCSGIDEHFIDGVDHDVLRGNVLEIDAINLP